LPLQDSNNLLLPEKKDTIEPVNRMCEFAIKARKCFMRTIHFTAVIEREGNGYVALCPDLDIASQGDTVEEARTMLKEAVELFFECADEDEIQRRTEGECYIVPMECSIA